MSDPVYVHPSDLIPDMGSRLLQRTLSGFSMLDIGGGSGVVGEDNWRKLGVERFVVADAWDGYDWSAYGDRIKFVVIPADKALATFGPQSFDIVQCCECIEHMPKDVGHQVLEDMKQIARRLVIMTCPNGFSVQDPALFASEPWAANPFQLHVCGWSADEFRAHGYEVAGNPALGPGRQLVPYRVSR